MRPREYYTCRIHVVIRRLLYENREQFHIREQDNLKRYFLFDVMIGGFFLLDNVKYMEV